MNGTIESGAKIVVTSTWLSRENQCQQTRWKSTERSTQNLCSGCLTKQRLGMDGQQSHGPNISAAKLALQHSQPM